MKLWLIKDTTGRIAGPYTEKEVCAFIKQGQFKESEKISLYPSGKWKPLSSHSLFYDEFLKFLNRKGSEGLEGFEEDKQVLEPTLVIPKPNLEPEKKKTQKKKLRFTSKKADEAGEEWEDEDQVIEMEDVEEAFFHKIKRIIILPFLAIAALATVLFFFLQTDEEVVHKGYVRLRAPNAKISQLFTAKKRNSQGGSKKNLENNWNKKIKKQFFDFFKDEATYYLKTQNRLVSVLQENPNISSGYYHLCLVHLELWPFSRQDFKDKQALTKVFSQINHLDKGGVYSGLCNAVISLTKSQYEKALIYVDTSLDVLGSTGESPVFFHYLRARILKKLHRFSESVSYLQSSYRIIPKWIKPYMIEAQILYEQKHYSAAAKIYKKILKISSSHPASQLRLGIIEYKHFKHYKKSEKRLKLNLAKVSDFIDHAILTEAYFILAQILFKQKDRVDAIKNVKKAYALDPSNESILKLVKQLGADKKIFNTKVDTRQIIYKGDLLRDQGDCNQAQIFYKKAYDLDHKKNALAAIQIAKCYWKTGVSGQSIQWLKKAIDADPQRMEAYFLLSDYLSTNYSFDAAKDVLNAARNQNVNSYEVFKGFALLALRQKSYKLAIQYAKHGLKFYASDVGIYNILSQASRSLRDYNKAYEYASKAIEEDVNDVQSQISFSVALGSAYGFKRGEKSLNKLIKLYPAIMEYRQALGEYYFDDERYDLALGIFSQIIKQNPKLKKAYIYLGRIYSFYGQRDQDHDTFEKAIHFLIKGSLLDPSDPKPLFYMGQVYMKNKQYLEAEDQFEKALGINGNYPLIHYYIGKANFYQGGEENLVRSLKFAKIESQKNPNLSLAYILSGDVYRKKADLYPSTSSKKRIHYELCAREYQKALKIRSKSIRLYIYLIECYRGSGELDAALQIVNQLFNSPGMSGYPELYRQAGLIYEIKGDYARAKAAYGKYFNLSPRAPDRARIERRLRSK